LAKALNLEALEIEPAMNMVVITLDCAVFGNKTKILMTTNAF